MDSLWKHYIQPPFLISMLLLVACSGGISYFKSRQGILLIKKPLPLKKPLDMLDEKLLEPYRVIQKSKIENKDELESLGTEDYIQWYLEDTTASLLSPVRNCVLFITYYTGNPDQVPHVPEACYTGGGHEMKKKFDIELDIGDLNIPGASKDGKIPATELIFARKTTDVWQDLGQFPVIYFFKVNGQYKGNRTTTRLALADFTSQYSYFSKVEVKFYNPKAPAPDVEEAKQATEKLLKILLPVLEERHWPEWK